MGYIEIIFSYSAPEPVSAALEIRNPLSFASLRLPGPSSASIKKAVSWICMQGLGIQRRRGLEPLASGCGVDRSVRFLSSRDMR